MLGWMRTYRRVWLTSDLTAGVALAAVLLPQGMAYAEVAGLPTVNGLYATLVALVAFAIFGSSRNLVLGPDSSTAAMVAAVLLPLAVAGSTEYVELAGALAILVGLLFLAMRVARLGFLSDFLAGPVITGYQAGLGVTIIVGQIPKLLGFSIDADKTLGEVAEIVRHLDETSMVTAAVGAGVLATILLLGRFAPRVPGILVAVAAAMVAAVAFDLADRGLALLGTLPSGFPPIGAPDVALDDLPLLIGGAAGIALVSFTDTVVEGRTAATRGNYEPEVDGDMIGVGAADIAAGFASGFPVSASGSRTVVAQTAGARTQLTNLAAAALVAFVLVVATGPLEYIPNAALAAVVISAGLRLVNPTGLIRLERLRRTEFAIALTTALGVVVFGVLPGIGIAVGLSLINFVRRSARPHTAVLGRPKGHPDFHSIARYPEASTTPGVVVFRFDAPLFFANANWFANRVQTLIATAEPPARWLVLDGSGITDVDTTAADVLRDLLRDLARQGVGVMVGDPLGRVLDQLARYGLTDAFGGEDHFFDTVAEAVTACGGDLP